MFLALFVDAIVDLHPLDEKMFNDVLIGKWKWILYVNKGLFISQF